jgi:hypothetical protein
VLSKGTVLEKVEDGAVKAGQLCHTAARRCHDNHHLCYRAEQMGDFLTAPSDSL